MSRRGNGEGTIYYSEKLNKWVGQYTAGRKDNGKLNRKSVYGNTRKEVKDKITKALSDIQNNTYIEKNNITVFELAKNILETKKESNIIKGVTYYKDKQILNIIEKGSIANIIIQKITSEQIQSFLNNQTHYSKYYLSKICEMTSLIFREAIKKDIISKNPMLNVIKPKSLKNNEPVIALTLEEEKSFVASLDDEPYKNIFLIALRTGMRIGEILALQPEDIDFENGLIIIDNTLSKNETGKTIIGDTTKTYSGNRKIPIISILEPTLKESIDNYIPNKNNLLFCHSNGEIISTTTINSHFKKCCKNADIKVKTVKKKKGVNKDNENIYVNLKTSDVHTHMLRHTYATRCIEAGVPAEVLQKLLGHKNITITINTYASIFDKFKKDALENYINYIKKI